MSADPMQMCTIAAAQWQGKAVGGPGMQNACIAHVWLDANKHCIASLVSDGNIFYPNQNGGADVSTHDGQVKHVPLSDIVRQTKVLPSADFLLTDMSGNKERFPCSKISVIKPPTPDKCQNLKSKWQGRNFGGGSGYHTVCLANVWSKLDGECMASLVTDGDVFTPRPDGGASVSIRGGQVVHAPLDDVIKMPISFSDKVSLKSPSGDTAIFQCSRISVSNS